jgi:hypothetical protein
MKSKTYERAWINILKISVLFLLILSQNCVFHKSPLQLKIINKSNDRIYIGPILSSCDSCDRERDVRSECTYKNSNQRMIRVLNANDSIELVDKLLLDKIRIYAIKADSLDRYCAIGATGNITNKNWVQILVGNVDIKNKTCSIIIE